MFNFYLCHVMECSRLKKKDEKKWDFLKSDNSKLIGFTDYLKAILLKTLSTFQSIKTQGRHEYQGTKHCPEL
jgi:hypothetical protein